MQFWMTLQHCRNYALCLLAGWEGGCVINIVWCYKVSMLATTYSLPPDLT